MTPEEMSAKIITALRIRVAELEAEVKEYDEANRDLMAAKDHLCARIAELEAMVSVRDKWLGELRARVVELEIERGLLRDAQADWTAHAAELEEALKKIENAVIVPDCEQSAWVWEVARAALVKSLT